MKYSTFFKIGVFCLTILLLGCEKDEIKSPQIEYVDGGIGTSQTSGAVEFNFNIPNNYATGRVRIEFPQANLLNEVNGIGYKQIRFSSVYSGTYNYTFEFWGIENNNSEGETEVPSLSKFFIIDETIEVKNGQTLIITQDVD